MISNIKFRWRLSRLFAQQDRVRGIYTAHLAKARKENARTEEIEQLNGEAWTEESMVIDEIDLLVTHFWLRRAQRLFVPIPERTETEMWKECRNMPRRVLTEKGITAVRTAVREEEKMGRDIWMVILTCATGIIGALTGLFAIFLSR